MSKSYHSGPSQAEIDEERRLVKRSGWRYAPLVVIGPAAAYGVELVFGLDSLLTRAAIALGCLLGFIALLLAINSFVWLHGLLPISEERAPALLAACQRHPELMSYWREVAKHQRSFTVAEAHWLHVRDQQLNVQKASCALARGPECPS